MEKAGKTKKKKNGGTPLVFPFLDELVGGDTCRPIFFLGLDILWMFWRILGFFLEENDKSKLKKSLFFFAMIFFFYFFFFFFL